MVILASLPRLNLFSSLPSTRPPNDPTASSTSQSLPIPIPKYTRSNRNTHNNQVRNPKDSLAFKLPHRKTKYYKPVKHGDVISLEGDGSRAVVIGESGVSYQLPGAPFEYQFSYSETPQAKPIAIREPAYLPFAPPSMPRPWTGKPPLKKDKAKKKIPFTDALNNVQTSTQFHPKAFPSEERTREEILGEPLKNWEIMEMIKPMIADNRQVNLGRDGVTHNMLNLVHSHWRRRKVCKVRCKGVPTVDMNNVCKVLEDKTGGKIIHRVGGVVYLYRGRNYKPHPEYPLMLWKPAAPVYPKLIQEAPEGLSKSEADEFRERGKTLLPICKLPKNGVYVTLVRDVRTAFELSPLVKIDCAGMHASDYKKLAAKLKELVPCVLLSFDGEQILMWRGQNWKPKYTQIGVLGGDVKGKHGGDGDLGGKTVSLWKSALDANKAILLSDTNVDADALLEMVEEFARVTQATEHTYEAEVVDSEDPVGESETDEDDEGEDFDDVDLDAPHGTLPIDLITKKLRDGNRKF